MINKIRIGERLVGEGEPVFIVAEVGSNHNQTLGQARQLIEVAARAGVDAVKFQLFKAENLYPNKDDAMFKIMKSIELPWEWLEELVDYAKSFGLMFLASPFSRDAVDILESLGAPAFKWASSETINLPLLRYAAEKMKPLLVATGMCDLADVTAAVEVIRSAGNQDIVLLQCTSLYPALPDQVNLRVMDTMKDTFHLPVGFSDHTLGFNITAAAVARGACVIEKHITLSRTMEGPDHFYAIEPDELKQMVEVIRNVEKSLGSTEKDMLPEEKKVAKRDSVVAARDIPENAVITREMVTLSRPALGIKPRFLPAILGSRVKTHIEKGQAITWEMLQ
jgi:N-acetylneuraminate synthase/N,N'-diacetyllegionaminate synthase